MFQPQLVVLSNQAVTLEIQRQALAVVCDGGQIIEWRGGELTSLISGDGENLLTVHAPKTLQDPAEAAIAVGRAVLPFEVWTEMKLPFGSSRRGRDVALAIAARVGGVVEELV